MASAMSRTISGETNGFNEKLSDEVRDEMLGVMASREPRRAVVTRGSS